MEAVKRIPYGVADFERVVEETMYYADKTMYLPLLEQQPDSLFFIRPRRFGKSLFLNMLRAYLLRDAYHQRDTRRPDHIGHTQQQRTQAVLRICLGGVAIIPSASTG